MATAALAVRISAQLASFESAFKDATKTLNKFESEFSGVATRAAAAGAFIGTIAADMAAALGRGIVNTFKDAIQASNEFNNAFIGLSSVASAFGTSADEAKAAAQKLSADGLLPVKDAAAGLKNLLAAGFSLPEATKLMNAFKDSAAFGRQGTLSFGDAVRSATEGVKNGNSILVDNAGITKNLSQILKEAGFSAQDLAKASSDAGVRQALLNGILRESAAFTGDANKLTQTYSGTLEGMKTSWRQLLATWGDAITQNKSVQIALGFVRDTFATLNGALSDNSRGYKLVTDVLVFFVDALALAIRSISFMLKAVNALDTGFAEMVKNVAADVKRLADIFLNLLVIASKVPGSTIAIAGMADEFANLARLSSAAGSVVSSMSGRIQENQDRVRSWGGTLDGFVTTLGGLKKTLQDSRGQVVEFGTKGSPALEKLGTSAEKGAEGLKKLAKEAEALVSRAMQRIIADEQKRLREEMERTTTVGLQQFMQGYRQELLLLLPAQDQWIERNNATVKSLQEILAKEGAWKGFNQAVEDSADAARKAEEAFREYLNAIGAVASVLDDLAASAGGSFGQQLADLANIVDAWGRAEAAAQQYAEATTLAGKIGAVASGVGAVWQATSSQNRGAAVAGGALSGAALGTKILPGWGTAIGAAAGAIVGFVRSAGQGREAVEEFAEAFGGFDALREKMNELGDEGERLWIKLTQTVGKNDVKAAEEAANEIVRAFDALKKPDEDIAAAGFKTRAELEALAQTAVDVYTRMRDSGKFTAADVQTAFERAQAAIRTAVGDTAQLESMDRIKGKIGELTQEYDRLFKAVADEAPEEEMGVIERQMRDRLKVIEQERGGLETQLEQMTTGLEEAFGLVGDAAKQAAKDIVAAFSGISIPPIQIPFELPDGVPQLATGGIVTRPTLALIGESGPEAVVPLGATGFEASAEQHIYIYQDGYETTHAVLRNLPDVARLYVR
jgi:uncharacterized protein YoxC